MKRANREWTARRVVIVTGAVTSPPFSEAGRSRSTGQMTFHDLHYGDRPLVLPNAWDVPSALAFLDAGFEAIGTTSFGVASGLGRPDGARSTREANIAVAAHLRTLPCYVSMDLED